MQRAQSFIAIVAALALTLFASVCVAVGAGEIQASAILGQPLTASFKLSGLDSLSGEDFRISLGDSETYQRLGLVRPDHLGALIIKLEPVRDGLAVAIRSSELLLEPSVDLVLDISWPNGKLIKSYTLLTEPPG